MSINAFKLTTTLTEDGTLTLTDLPCAAGTSVEVIILVLPPGENPSRVKEPGTDYLGTIPDTLTEWNSEADNSAYRHL